MCVQDHFSSLMGPYGTIGQWSFFPWLLGRNRPIFLVWIHIESISTDFWLKSTVDAISTVFSSMCILIDRRYRPYSQVGESLWTVDIDRDWSTGRLKSNRPIDDTCAHLSLFPVTKNVTPYICHISGKNVMLSHTKIFFLTCDVFFCQILPEKSHILAPPVQNFFEREEMWRFGWERNMFFSSRLRPLPFKVGLGISRTNADSQWNPVYNAFHRFFCCGNETIRR